MAPPEKGLGTQDHRPRFPPIVRALVELPATSAAAAALDAELPYPLSDLVAALFQALRRRPFRQRIAVAALTLDDESHAPFRVALGGRGEW